MRFAAKVIDGKCIAFKCLTDERSFVFWLFKNGHFIGDHNCCGVSVTNITCVETRDGKQNRN